MSSAALDIRRRTATLAVAVEGLAEAIETGAGGVTQTLRLRLRVGREVRPVLRRDLGDLTAGLLLVRTVNLHGVGDAEVSSLDQARLTPLAQLVI
jgi:hypothetical protein